MYAVVDVGGKQVRVRPDEVVQVPLMDADEGSEVTFDRVLLVRTDDSVRVGSPVIEGAKVTAKVLRHGKAEKVMVYKYKRRKYYRRKRGHRQPFTEVKISQIVV